MKWRPGIGQDRTGRAIHVLIRQQGEYEKGYKMIMLESISVIGCDEMVE